MAACTAVPSRAPRASAPRRQYAVGVHNATDLIRAATGGRATVHAHPVHQGRTQQVWEVTVTDGRDKLLARGQVRLHNLDHPSFGP